MNNIYVVMYHYVRDLKHSRYLNIKGLDISFFKKQITYLKENFNIVKMEDVILASNGEKKPNKAMLLTFNDGYIDNYTYILPVLLNEGL